MYKGNPFQGDGSGKSQPSGPAGGIHSFTENTGPASKAGGKDKTSHPTKMGNTEGPSGDIGVSKWDPK